MNFGSFSLGSVVADAAKALTKGLATPIGDYNKFLGLVNPPSAPTTLASSPGGLKYGLGTSSNPYARQNVLQVMQQRGDPILGFDWIAVILDPTVNVSKQLPWQYIDTLTTPSLSIDVQQLFRNGKNLKFASTFSADTMSLSLYTDVNSLSVNYANNWIRSVYRSDGFFNLSKNYKRDIQVYLLDATRSVVVDMRFIGCFPTSWDSYPLSRDGSILETNLTLSVDDFVLSYETDTTAAKTSISQTFSLNEQIERAVTSVRRQVASFIAF